MEKKKSKHQIEIKDPIKLNAIKEFEKKYNCKWEERDDGFVVRFLDGYLEGEFLSMINETSPRLEPTINHCSSECVPGHSISFQCMSDFMDIVNKYYYTKFNYVKNSKEIRLKLEQKIKDIVMDLKDSKIGIEYSYSERSMNFENYADEVKNSNDQGRYAWDSISYALGYNKNSPESLMKISGLIEDLQIDVDTFLKIAEIIKLERKLKQLEE